MNVQQRRDVVEDKVDLLDIDVASRIGGDHLAEIVTLYEMAENRGAPYGYVLDEIVEEDDVGKDFVACHNDGRTHLGRPGDAPAHVHVLMPDHGIDVDER